MRFPPFTAVESCLKKSATACPQRACISEFRGVISASHRQAHPAWRRDTRDPVRPLRPPLPRRRSTARTASTRPAPTRPDGRRGGRPPTLADRPDHHPRQPRQARQTATGPRSRSRGSASTPTPATVWTAGTAPIDLDATWPAALVERIVTSFSEPGARVVLLDWPTPNRAASTLTAVGADGVIDHAPARRAGPRTGRRRRCSSNASTAPRASSTSRSTRPSTGPASRPFWADLVGGPDQAPATVPPAHPRPPPRRSAPDAATTSTPARRPDRHQPAAAPLGDHSDHGDHGADLVALYAARRLRVGGILAVLTHCDWTTGELTDPTGAVVAAGQNADLLYLQHIVALHAPVRDGRFRPRPTPTPHDRLRRRPSDVHGDDGGDGDGTCASPRPVRGLPEPHRRIHSDVLVFAQPHDHQPHLRATAERAHGRGLDERRPPMNTAPNAAHRTPTSPTPDRTARKARP